MAFGKKNHVNLDPLSYSSCLLGEAKVGKEQPVSEPVLTENGWVRMGDIKIGTKVYGRDGKLHNVIGVYPQGIKDVYEVTFRDGTKTRCGLEHLWKVYTKKQRELNRKDNKDRHKVISLKEIINDYKKYIENPKHRNGGYFSYKYSVPINKPIEFDNHENLPIDAYALGLLLGDGGFTGNVITFTNSEQELFYQLENLLKSLGIELHIRNFDNHKQANLVSVSNNRNKLVYNLAELDLIGCDSRQKFIPNIYLNATIDNRIKLLSGIINTDGSVDGARIIITTYSEQLSKNIAELARSLGFIASILDYDRTDSNSTKKHDKEIEYRVSIISSDYSALQLSSKHKAKIKGKNIEYVKSIKNIRLVDREESQCIMLDSDEHLYITNDYIVTHNTTLVKEVCEKLVGEDGYMFLELGQERGGDAIEGINHVNCPEWEMEYDELTNSAGFSDVCEDIIENKTSEYPDLKVVIWDTYDQLITIAEQESIAQWNKECRDAGHPEKVAKSINAAWGGFGKGEKKTIELMFDMKARLKRVGVETFVIGHVKTKDVTDVVSGETYQTLTSDQQQNYFNALKKNLHFLGLAYIDRTIAKEKTGRQVIKGKKKVDEEVNKVKEESRKIKFRDDNYAVDSGSRFADIVPEINLDADEFIKALTDAILTEQKKSGMTVKQTQAEQDKIKKAEEKRIAEAEKKNNEKKELDKVVADIIKFFTENKSDVNVIKPILNKVKELGYANPKEIDSVEDAQIILAMTQQN